MSINQIIFGGVSIATLSRRKKAHELIKHILKRGIRNFDTAPLYSLGYSERLLGQLLKGVSGIKLTSKFGGLGYPDPKTNLPLKVVMPLNYLRRKFLTNKKLIQNQKKAEQTINTKNINSIEAIINPFNESLRRLQMKHIDTYLLHEILPFDLPSDWEKTLLDLKKSGLLKQIGYGGGFSEELFSSRLPSWISIIQIPFPLRNSKKQDYLRNWLALNPTKEIRFYGLFQNGVDPAQISLANQFLDDFSNTKIVFSCRSKERFDSNLKMFGII